MTTDRLLKDCCTAYTALLLLLANWRDINGSIVNDTKMRWSSSLLCLVRSCSFQKVPCCCCCGNITSIVKVTHSVWLIIGTSIDGSIERSFVRCMLPIDRYLLVSSATLECVLSKHSARGNCIRDPLEWHGTETTRRSSRDRIMGKLLSALQWNWNESVRASKQAMKLKRETKALPRKLLT